MMGNFEGGDLIVFHQSAFKCSILSKKRSYFFEGISLICLIILVLFSIPIL